MAANQQMYDQALNVLKGYAPTYGLDKQAKLAADLRLESIGAPAGRVVYLTEDGEFALGGAGHTMPIFLVSNSDDRDVSNDGVSPISGIRNWVGVNPPAAGKMNGLVASGGYELQTTEFDSDLTYAPNDLLTADAEGILTNDDVVQYVDWICGVASWHEQGKVGDAAATSASGNNAHGVAVLTFWTYFLPAAVAN